MCVDPKEVRERDKKQANKVRAVLCVGRGDLQKVWPELKEARTEECGAALAGKNRAGVD